MKLCSKIFALSIVVLFVVSELVITGIANNTEERVQETRSIYLSTPSFERKGDYVIINFEE